MKQSEDEFEHCRQTADHPVKALIKYFYRKRMGTTTSDSSSKKQIIGTNIAGLASKFDVGRALENPPEIVAVKEEFPLYKKMKDAIQHILPKKAILDRAITKAEDFAMDFEVRSAEEPAFINHLQDARKGKANMEGFVKTLRMCISRAEKLAPNSVEMETYVETLEKHAADADTHIDGGKVLMKRLKTRAGMGSSAKVAT